MPSSTHSHLAHLHPRTRAAAAAFAALAAIVAFLRPASAQVAYVEPPDLSDISTSPTPVGTLAPGVNTVDGTIAMTFDAGHHITGDNHDAFSFVVPVGLEVTDIQVTITGMARSHSAGSVESPTNEVFANLFAQNETFTLQIRAEGGGSGGTLPAGTHTLRAVGYPTTPDESGNCSFTYQIRLSVGLANDACASASPVGPGATAFNSTDAGTDGPDHPECSYFGSPAVFKDLWYTFTPTADGLLTADTCGSSFDTKLAIYQGGSCDNLGASILACNDDNGACGTNSRQSSLQQEVSAGQAYLVRVGGFSNASGPGTLNLALATTGACCNRATGGCIALSRADCTALGHAFGGFGVACSPANCTACPVDFNNSGVVSVQDIFDFLAAYFAGCP